MTDGTTEGTSLLKDCTPGDSAGDPYDSNPNEFLVHDGKLYFKIQNNTAGGDTIWEIWVTDGTEGGYY